jgi:hypothetical protein
MHVCIIFSLYYFFPCFTPLCVPLIVLGLFSLLFLRLFETRLSAFWVRTTRVSQALSLRGEQTGGLKVSTGLTWGLRNLTEWRAVSRKAIQVRVCSSSWYSSLSIKVSILDIGRAIAQAVSRWLPTAGAWVRARVWSRGICGEQSGGGAGFLRVLRFPLPIFFPPITPQSPSSIIWGLYNRPEVAAVPSGLSLTPLIKKKYSGYVIKTVWSSTHNLKTCSLWFDVSLWF